MHSVHLLSSTWFSFWPFVFHRLLFTNFASLFAHIAALHFSVCEIFFLRDRERKKEIKTDQRMTGDGGTSFVPTAHSQIERTDKCPEHQPAQNNIFTFATQFFGFTSFFISFCRRSWRNVTFFVCWRTKNSGEIHVRSPPLCTWVWKSIRADKRKFYTYFPFHLLLLFRIKWPNAIYTIYLFKYKVFDACSSRSCGKCMGWDWTLYFSSAA